MQKLKFKFLNNSSKNPKRIIILGTTGIISRNLQKKLKINKISFLKIGKKNIDLRKKKSVQYMKNIIKDQDVIIFIAAEAPVKNQMMRKNNILICRHVCEAISKKDINNLIYVSSDAVYSDINKKIKETSPTRPTSLHGKMHLYREKILKSFFKNRLCIVRPTLVYGPGDTHNGYGPNRFVNLAIKKKEIYLFGKGEERRDHIYVEDLISILFKCILMRAAGIINGVTGKVYSFLKIAQITNEITNNKKTIFNLKRIGPMPHNGHRPFDNSLLKKKFKKIKITKIDKGIKDYISQIK